MAAMNPLTMLGIGGLVALSAYVHRTCMRSLGPNKVDNVVHFHPADAAAAATASPAALHPPLLIVTLGWGGSTCKQLRRIVAHCTHTLGCPVITYINSMMQYLHGDLDQVQIRNLLEQIKEKTEGSVAPAGFVILLHSNNGAFVYGEMKRHFNDHTSPYYSLRSHFRGVVLDSSPAIHPVSKSGSVVGSVRDALVGALGFSFPSVAIILNRPQYAHWFWTPAVALWVLAFMIVKAVLGAATGSGGNKAQGQGTGRARASAAHKRHSDTRQLLADGLYKSVPDVPHLFLYSSGDKLLESKFVESYISFLRNEHPSVPVLAHDFVRTGHVQHFLREPAEYARRLRDFLEMLQKNAQTKRTLLAAQRAG